jgi:hypothetical protein
MESGKKGRPPDLAYTTFDIRFALELHTEKTRLIEFGQFAAQRRAEHGAIERIGHANGAWSSAGSRLPSTGIRGPNTALTLESEAGAQCVGSAPLDLCGGRRATGVPTATEPRDR